MASFDTFKIWYAKSLALNGFDDADGTHKIRNFVAPGAEAVSLLMCNPLKFQKRNTDVSNAQAVDPTAPDTGTGGSDIVLRFTQKREVSPQTVSVLDKLLTIFYEFQSDDDFVKGRIGIENTDNPDLDCLPIALAGYKMTSFKQEPNQNQPALMTYEVILKFLGDHTKLGTRS